LSVYKNYIQKIKTLKEVDEDKRDQELEKYIDRLSSAEINQLTAVFVVLPEYLKAAKEQLNEELEMMSKLVKKI